MAAAGDASAWQWRDRFRDDHRRVIDGRPPLGPRELTPAELIESAGTAAEVEAAVAAAMGRTDIKSRTDAGFGAEGREGILICTLPL